MVIPRGLINGTTSNFPQLTSHCQPTSHFLTTFSSPFSPFLNLFSSFMGYRGFQALLRQLAVLTSLLSKLFFTFQMKKTPPANRRNVLVLKSVSLLNFYRAGQKTGFILPSLSVNYGNSPKLTWKEKMTEIFCFFFKSELTTISAH